MLNLQDEEAAFNVVVPNNDADYIPLLNNWRQLLPGYHLRRPADSAEPSTGGPSVRNSDRKLSRKVTSLSPAGLKQTTASRTKLVTSRERTPSNLSRT
jgi:hypothetical protein